MAMFFLDVSTYDWASDSWYYVRTLANYSASTNYPIVPIVQTQILACKVNRSCALVWVDSNFQVRPKEIKQMRIDPNTGYALYILVLKILYCASLSLPFIL